jgi:hypothetical protein
VKIFIKLKSKGTMNMAPNLSLDYNYAELQSKKKFKIKQGEIT